MPMTTPNTVSPGLIDTQPRPHPPDMAARLKSRIPTLPLARPAVTTGYRLVHGENDGLPGLVLDRYDETLVLKL